MKVALIGASGFVGSAILKELLDRGHEVKAIVRDVAKVKAAGANLQVAAANALNEDEVAAAVAGYEAVISAYNPGWTNPDLYREFLQGAQAIQAGVKQAGLKRLIVIGGAGSLYVAEGVQAVDTPAFPNEWKAGATAARDYLHLLKQEEELNWTFLSPAMEMHPGTSGLRKGTYRTALENPVFNDEGRSIISVEDLALAVVDELERPKHQQQRFTAAY